MAHKFDTDKLEKLNDPERKKLLDPDIIWETLKLEDPEILVDIGAGTGFFAVPFSRKMKNGKIYACDVSEEMVSWMKNNLSKEDLEKIVPLKTEESRVDLPDCIADLVYMINVYHELENPQMMLRETYRILKENGRTAVIDWKKEEHSFYSIPGPPLHRRVSKEIIKKELTDSGFDFISDLDILTHHSFIVGVKTLP